MKVFNCRRWEWKSWSRSITQWYVRKSQQNLWFLKDQCIFKLLIFYTSQPRLADCWQLHDIFAVTWLESETSDKFLVWMSLCDMQWQIYFCYYKYVACPMVGDFGTILGVALSELLAFLVLLFHHPRKDGENDTFLICCDGSFFFCDVGAWHRLISFSLSSVKTVCWQEAVNALQKRIQHFQLLLLNFMYLGYMSHELTFKNLECFWSDNTIFWADSPPRIHIQYWRRDNVNQFYLHVTEHVEELNLHILACG